MAKYLGMLYGNLGFDAVARAESSDRPSFRRDSPPLPRASDTQGSSLRNSVQEDLTQERPRKDEQLCPAAAMSFVPF